MKKGIYLLLIVSLLLVLPFNVYAVAGPLTGDQVLPIIKPGVATYYDISTDGKTVTALGTRSGSVYYSNPEPLTVNNTNSNGGLICFTGDDLFYTGVLYSLTVYIGATNIDYVPQNVAILKGPLGRGLSTGSTITGTASSYASGKTSNVYYNYYAGTASALDFTNQTTGSQTLYSGRRYLVFEPVTTGTTACVDFTTSSTYSYFLFYGYNMEILGITDGLSSQDIQDAIKSSGLASASSVSQVQKSVNELKSEVKAMQEEQQKTNEKLDEIIDMGPDDSAEKPDSSSYDDYSKGEQQLLDSVKDVDMGVLDIGMDSKSSSFVWDTLTDFIKSHPSVFGMFIAILSLGIIKLALGR